MIDEYNKVYEFLNLEPKYNIKYDIEFVSENKSKLNNNLYNKLTEYYKNDIKKLEKLLDVKLDWIKTN